MSKLSRADFWWALGWGLLGVAACAVWVYRAEIVVLACQITESVPAIPAVALLLVLVALRAGIRRLRKKKRSLGGSGEAAGLRLPVLLNVYTFSAIALSMMGCGIGRYFFANLTALYYYASPENGFAQAHHDVPTWLVPQGPHVIRDFYLGTPAGVPWHAWIVPLLAWSALFLALWVTLVSVTVLVNRPWAENEKLAFPLVYLPRAVTGAGEVGSSRPFFRDPVMWLGFGVAAAYNAVNIGHALQPWLPEVGKSLQIGATAAPWPWDAALPLTLWIRPEMVGFGYLVSQEVNFSIWACFLGERVLAVMGRMLSWDVPGYPLPQEQSIGAYLMLGVFLAWKLWPTIRRAFSSAGEAKEFPSIAIRSEMAMETRRALLGAGLGFLGVLAWCRLAGMQLWVAALYFGVVVAVALVYARIRAETGVPLIWMFPFYQQKRLLVNVLGSGALAGQGHLANLTMLSLLAIFSRGYFPSLIGYPLEHFQLAEAQKIGRRRVLTLLIVAVPVGLVAAFVAHLVAYYHHGAAQLSIWGGTWLAVPEYQELISLRSSPRPMNVPATVASASGAAVALVFAALRLRFAWWPLHPLGYAMATAYGDLVWGPFFCVWVIKGLVLRYGGQRLYRRGIPFFLGLVLGHFLVAGVFWGLCGLYSPDAVKSYAVWFG